MIVLVFTWLTSMAFSLLPLFGRGIGFIGSVFTCTIANYYSPSEGFNGDSFIYFCVFVVISCIIPVAVLLITNTWMLCIIRKSISKGYHREILISGRRPSLSAELKDKYKKNQLRLLQMFGSLCCSSFCIWAPTIISVVLLSMAIVPAFTTFAHLCLLSQTVIHPAIQTVYHKDVRDEMARFFKHCKLNKTNILFQKGIFSQQAGESGCDPNECIDCVEHYLCQCPVLDRCGAALIAYHSKDSNPPPQNQTETILNGVVCNEQPLHIA